MSYLLTYLPYPTSLPALPTLPYLLNVPAEEGLGGEEELGEVGLHAHGVGHGVVPIVLQRLIGWVDGGGEKAGRVCV